MSGPSRSPGPRRSPGARRIHAAFRRPAALLALALLAGCPGRPGEEAPGPVSEGRSIEAVLAERTEEWMAVPGVVGTGIGLCDSVPCIVVFVADANEEIRARIPSEVEGHPVRLEATGEFRPRPAPGP